MLSRNTAQPVRVFAVWEPILVTDFAPPLNAVLGRLADPRVQQYWDRRHAASDQLRKDARPPQPEPECCDRSGHLWDLAAVYPPGVMWTERMPVATVFTGPVVDVADRIAEVLTPTTPR